MYAIDDIEDDEERRMTIATVLDMAGEGNTLLPIRATEMAGLIDRLFAQRRN